jgi:hypothetical protein
MLALTDGLCFWRGMLGTKSGFGDTPLMFSLERYIPIRFWFLSADSYLSSLRFIEQRYNPSTPVTVFRLGQINYW